MHTASLVYREAYQKAILEVLPDSIPSSIASIVEEYATTGYAGCVAVLVDPLGNSPDNKHRLDESTIAALRANGFDLKIEESALQGSGLDCAIWTACMAERVVKWIMEGLQPAYFDMSQSLEMLPCPITGAFVNPSHPKEIATNQKLIKSIREDIKTLLQHDKYQESIIESIPPRRTGKSSSPKMARAEDVATEINTGELTAASLPPQVIKVNLATLNEEDDLEQSDDIECNEFKGLSPINEVDNGSNAISLIFVQ